MRLLQDLPQAGNDDAMGGPLIIFFFNFLPPLAAGKLVLVWLGGRTRRVRLSGLGYREL